MNTQPIFHPIWGLTRGYLSGMDSVWIVMPIRHNRVPFIVAETVCQTDSPAPQNGSNSRFFRVYRTGKPIPESSLKSRHAAPENGTDACASNMSISGAVVTRDRLGRLAKIQQFRSWSLTSISSRKFRVEINVSNRKCINMLPWHAKCGKLTAFKLPLFQN